MRRQNYIFSSESVAEGHPDKVCDIISDSVVDACLSVDPFARAACEVMATTNRVIIAGEFRGAEEVWNTDLIDQIVRSCVRDIGYEQEGFHWRKLEIQKYVHGQSDDIANCVGTTGLATGAGDQGIMFGYAVRQTDLLMPAAIYYAHEVLRIISIARRAGKLLCFGPDAKSQITLRYERGMPVEVMAVVMSIQCFDESLTSSDIRGIVEPYIREVLPKEMLTLRTRWHINEGGRFVVGGPDGDTGLTGRKIVVDTYGGAAPHGGGCFSGKDPSKVDRSAAYMARYLAKNIVEAGMAEECCVQLSYIIGGDAPVSIHVDTYGTGIVAEHQLENFIISEIDLSPVGIQDHLSLACPIYRRTASYGHFGREVGNDGAFSWEKTDLVDLLKNAPLDSCSTKILSSVG